MSKSMLISHIPIIFRLLFISWNANARHFVNAVTDAGIEAIKDEEVLKVVTGTVDAFQRAFQMWPKFPRLCNLHTHIEVEIPEQ